MLHGHAPLSTAASWTQLGAPAPALRGVDVLLIIARHPRIRARCRAREMPFYPPKNPIDNRFYVEVRAWDAHWGARAIKELGNLIGGVHVIQQVWMVIRHGTKNSTGERHDQDSWANAFCQEVLPTCHMQPAWQSTRCSSRRASSCREPGRSRGEHRCRLPRVSILPAVFTTSGGTTRGSAGSSTTVGLVLLRGGALAHAPLRQQGAQ